MNNEGEKWMWKVKVKKWKWSYREKRKVEGENENEKWKWEAKVKMKWKICIWKWKVKSRTSESGDEDNDRVKLIWALIRLRNATWQTTKSFELYMQLSSGGVSGQFEDYPETLTISVSPDMSNSLISSEMKNRMGVYQRTSSTRNDRPEWEQKEVYK